jgi:hypothetical protein
MTRILKTIVRIVTRPVVVFGITLLLGLGTVTACAADHQEPDTERTPEEAYSLPDVATFTHKLPSGRYVECVWAKNYNAGGLSCFLVDDAPDL